MVPVSDNKKNPVSPALAALRAATASRHQAIEGLLGLDAAMPLARYGRIVQGFEAFLCEWEPRAAAMLPPQLRDWFAGRSRLALARRDLQALSLPRLHTPLPARFVDGAAQALGSLYVMEGSMLGGQVISRRLSESLGLDAASGAAYFAGWGGETGAMWRDFLSVLAGHLPPQAEGEACEGARRTFDTLGGLFQGLLNEPAAA